MKTSFQLRDDFSSPIINVDLYMPTYAQGIILFVHDLGETRLSYEALAKYANSLHFGFVLYDLRGHYHALVDDKKGHFGDKGGAAILLRDLYRISYRIKKEHPLLPLSLMGQGFGALLAQVTYQQNQAMFAHVCLINPYGLSRFVGLKKALLSFLHLVNKDAYVKDSLFYLLPRKDLKKKDRYRFLSSYDHLIDRYLKDPYCGYLYTSAALLDIYRIWEMSREILACEYPQKEVILVACGQDPLCHYGKNVEDLKEAYMDAGYFSTTLLVHPTGGHHFIWESQCDVGANSILRNIFRLMEKRA